MKIEGKKRKKIYHPDRHPRIIIRICNGSIRLKMSDTDIRLQSGFKDQSGFIGFRIGPLINARNII